MKRRPDRSNVQRFDPDAFIDGANADAPTGRSTRSKPAAAGSRRCSFDLPEDLFRRLKLQAVETDRPMRELVEEALLRYLA